MKSGSHTTFWLSGISAIALLSSGAAMAAETTTAAGAQASGTKSATTTESQPASVSEVTVTAQFRSQNVQDTPLAITAVNARAIEARNLSTVVDIAATSPSLEIRSGGSAYGPAPQIYIRGIGQVETTYAYDPGVGLYVDDVYYGSALGSVMDLLDLDRVEILRGPQGTLAGMNSVGGAIKLFSQKPTGDGHGYLELGYGAFDRLEAKGSLDLPLVANRLSLRISGMAKRRDGYLTRLDYACLHPGSGVPSAVTGPDCKLGTEGGIETEALRAALRWTPSDKLEVNVVGTISRDNSEIAATKLLSANFKTNIPKSFDQSLFVTGPTSYTNYATYTTQAYTDPASYAGKPGYGTHDAISVLPESHARARIVSGNIDYDLTDAVKLTSITAYQHMNGFFGKDIDLTPYGVNTINYTFDHQQFTQELRANAQVGTLLDFTIGGFYYDARSIFGGLQLNSPGTSQQNTFLLHDVIKSRSESVFAHAVAHLTDRLNVTGGIRYTYDFKSYQFARKNPYAPDLPANASSGGLDGVIGAYKSHHIDYRGDVDYRWSDQLMTYAQVSTGFRGGGVNPRPYVPEQATPFGPETVTAYEVGFKSDLFDRRVRLNGDIFLNKYNDIVFFDRSPTPHSVNNATPVNAGDGTFKGAELELEVRPAGGLQLEGSASYLHFHLDRVSAAGANIAGTKPDAKAPNAPEWQLSFAAQYAFDAGDVGTITPRVDVAYKSSMYPDIINTESAKTEARTLVNARISWKSLDGDWEGALSVSNLLDKFYYYSKVNYPIGGVVGDLAPPREWKVSIRRSF